MRHLNPTRLATVAVHDAAADPAVVDLVRMLVRPGFAALLADSEDWRIRAEFGSGLGRISKSAVASAADLRAVLAAAAVRLGNPLLITANQEGGRLNALDWPDMAVFPGAMALGAAQDPGLARAAGAALGRQMRALGVTWNLAPVCDLATPVASPLLGTRCFGADPDRVAELAAGMVDGLQGAGVAATAKHFPGLGGTSVAPYEDAVQLDRLAPGALVPFAAAVDAGVAAVMVGNHVVRDVDPDRPAVLSGRVVDGLLRTRLGFDGVVTTQNLSLLATRWRAGGLGAAGVLALQAGVDLLMLDSEVPRAATTGARRAGNTAAAVRRAVVVAAVLAAVETGQLTVDRLRESAARIAALARRFAISGEDLAGSGELWRYTDQSAAELAGAVARRSVTVVRAAPGELPLRLPDGMPVMVARLAEPPALRADSSWQNPFHFPELLAATRSRVEVCEPGLLPARCQDGQRVLLVTHDAYRTGEQLRLLDRLRDAGCHLVQVATGDPADLARSPAQVCVAAYGSDRHSCKAVVDVLVGRLRPAGQLPVPSPT